MWYQLRSCCLEELGSNSSLLIDAGEPSALWEWKLAQQCLRQFCCAGWKREESQTLNCASVSSLPELGSLRLCTGALLPASATQLCQLVRWDTASDGDTQLSGWDALEGYICMEYQQWMWQDRTSTGKSGVRSILCNIPLNFSGNKTTSWRHFSGWLVVYLTGFFISCLNLI